MKHAASQAWTEITEAYVGAGYPNHRLWRVPIGDSRQQHALPELRAQGLVRKRTLSGPDWVLTDEGQAMIVESVPISQEAADLFADLGARYKAAGCPNRRRWVLPHEKGRERVLAELNARGLVEVGNLACTRWLLTDVGVREALKIGYDERPAGY